MDTDLIEDTEVLRPKLCGWMKHTRNIRPNIKIGKEKFQLQLDVRNFDKDEIRVKARPEYVIIEGKQQKQTKRGLVMRQFIRKFRLPSGCNTNNMESKLSPEGILTITAPRKTCDENMPCEQLIPVSPDMPHDADVSFVPVQDVKTLPCKVDPCANYRESKVEEKKIDKVEQKKEDKLDKPGDGKC